MKDLPTILIADDDSIYLGVAESMAKNLGYPVITALNGVDAVRIFERNSDSIGIVLLDINMPEMNGVDTFHKIRAICQKARVIIISGNSNKTIRKQLSPLNPFAYMKKPISFEALSGLLNSISPD